MSGEVITGDGFGEPIEASLRRQQELYPAPSPLEVTPSLINSVREIMTRHGFAIPDGLADEVCQAIITELTRRQPQRQQL